MQYSKIEEIGRGGFGIVYKAQGEDGDKYAVKVLNPAAFPQDDHAMLIRRFEREVRYQQMVDHPNVVRVIEHDLTTSPPYFVMPIAAGSLKDDLEADRTLGGAPRKPLFDILAGLEALHKKGLRHRDLKPANVLKFPQPDGSVIYGISDFGLTTPGVGQTSTLTGSNMAGGTPMYRPPECANNFRRATEQADIYSFGAILHDIFGGGARVPHSELTVAGALKPVVEKCTKAQPRRRYASIAALREHLFNVLDNETIYFFSREEEDVIAILKSKDNLTDEEWDRAFNLIDDNADKGVSNRNLMRALTLSHISSIFDSSPDMFQALGGLYADFSVSEDFGFDYCDIISDKAEVFFNLGDLPLKAKTALAMLELGTSHNRWRVERQFMRMAGHDCDPALAERIKMEVIASEFPFEKRMPAPRGVNSRESGSASSGVAESNGWTGVKVGYFTIAGPKGQNHDAVLPPFQVGECSWCAIADGVGSSAFAGLAARTSIAVVKQLADSTLPMAELFAFIRERLSEIAREQENEKSISTTLSVLRICGNKAFVGHVGDTRISHYRGSGVIVRSKDQTEVQNLLDGGILSKNQALRYPRRNVLLSAMSANRGYDLYEKQFAVQKGDRILLTSDGFHSKLMRRRLADISSSRVDFDDFWSAVKEELSSKKLDDDASCLALEID